MARSPQIRTSASWPAYYFRLIIGLALLVTLIVGRMVWHDSLHFGFLLWNLFLACIPMLASHLIHAIRKPLAAYACGGFWLLFFPNSAYLLTDIIHLHIRPGPAFWLDVAILFGAALFGIVLSVRSLQQVESWYSAMLPARTARWLTAIILFMAGYGIYLGRVERWNSWDLLFDTRTLICSIAYELRHPIRCIDAWILSMLFTWMLGLAYLLLGGITPKMQLSRQPAWRERETT